MNNNTHPELRINKNGIPVIKHVRSDPHEGKSALTIPSPRASKPEPLSFIPAVRDGSLLAQHGEGTEELLESCAPSKDGSVSLSKNDVKMLQNMLNTALQEDKASKEDDITGYAAYLLTYLPGKGDINALRTIYARVEPNGPHGIETEWNALRIMRSFGICDEETNYGSDPRFDAVSNAMLELGISKNPERYSEYEEFDGYEDELRRASLLQFIWSRPDDAQRIIDTVIDRETFDVNIIQQAVESDAPSLGGGFL